MRLQPAGLVFTVGPGESPLNAGLRQGIALRYGCRRGRCSSCKYKVLEGEVDFGEASPYSLSEKDREEGWALLCCARAASDLVVLDDYAGDQRLLPVIVPTEQTARVRAVERISRSLWRLGLSVSNGLEFYPGQFVEVGVPDRPQEWRSYSIASPPSRLPELELIIKRIEAGAFSAKIDQLALGAPVALRGPYGTSYLRDGENPVLLIATGSGIAPIMSILRHAADVGDRRSFALFYGARTQADVPLREGIETLRSVLKDFRFELTLSAPTRECAWGGPQGRVTRLIQHRIRDASPYDAHLCGAPAMCDAVALLLAAKGIEDGRIFVDQFYSTCRESPEELDLNGRGDGAGYISKGKFFKGG